MICQLFPDYKQFKKKKINRILYNIKDLFLFWYKNFFIILKKIGLKLYIKKFYIYINIIY
jgi:hypothetical protein